MWAQTRLQDQKGCMVQALPAVGDNSAASLSDKAKRNSLLTSFLYSCNNQIFPPKILSSDNRSCYKVFILSVQLTRSLSRRSGHSIVPENQHSKTQKRYWLTAPSGKNFFSHQQKCTVLMPMESRLAHIIADSGGFLFSSHIANDQFHPLRALSCFISG